jgi:hypothetical protein
MIDSPTEAHLMEKNMVLKITSNIITTLSLIFLGIGAVQAASIENLESDNVYFNVYPNDIGTAYERADIPRQFQLTSILNVRMNPPHKVLSWTFSNASSMPNVPPFGTTIISGTNQYTYREGSRPTSIRERMTLSYAGPTFSGPAVQACNAALDSVPSHLRQRSLSIGVRAYVRFNPKAVVRTTAEDRFIVNGPQREFTINCLPWRGDRTEDIERRDAVGHGGPGQFQSIFIRTHALPRRTGQPCQLFIRVTARNTHQNQSMSYHLFGPRHRSFYRGVIRTDRYGVGRSDHAHILENQSGPNQGVFYISTQELSSNRAHFSVDCSAPIQRQSTTPTPKVKPELTINPHMKQVPRHPKIKQLQELKK